MQKAGKLEQNRIVVLNFGNIKHGTHPVYRYYSATLSIYCPNIRPNTHVRLMLPCFPISSSLFHASACCWMEEQCMWTHYLLKIILTEI